VLAHRPCHSLKQFFRFKLADNMVVDFQQQAELISLPHDLSVVKLRGISRYRALERDRNVGCEGTEHLNVFGGKLLPLQLWR
jgi:hypothetical protein